MQEESHYDESELVDQLSEICFVEQTEPKKIEQRFPNSSFTTLGTLQLRQQQSEQLQQIVHSDRQKLKANPKASQWDLLNNSKHQ